MQSFKDSPATTAFMSSSIIKILNLKTTTCTDKGI